MYVKDLRISLKVTKLTAAFIVYAMIVDGCCVHQHVSSPWLQGLCVLSHLFIFYCVSRLEPLL